MPGKEGKRKRGIETAAHNCVEIEGSLYAITHITGFRLDHKWNRTSTMDDNTVTSLVTIAVLIQGIAMPWPRCEFLSRFREDRILRLTYKTLECLLQIKTEGTDPVLFDSSRAVDDCHWWCKCQGKCQPCYIVMRITVT